MSGPAYGRGPFSKLWWEYANADRRWGGTYLTVVGLEILTVFVAGPLALWCAEMVKLGEWNHLGRKGVDNSKWFQDYCAGNRRDVWRSVAFLALALAGFGIDLISIQFRVDGIRSRMAERFS